jgi:hypothetical protein
VAFLGALDGSPPSVGILAGVKLGLGTGFQTYAEVARSSASVSALGRRSQGQSSGSGDTAKVVVDRPAVVRCGLEVLSPEDRTAMEKQACGPMGKDRRVVEKPSSRVCVYDSACVSRDASAEGDISLLKDGVSALSGVLGKFMKLIGCLSKALVWACGSSKQMGFKSSFSFKRRPGSQEM